MRWIQNKKTFSLFNFLILLCISLACIFFTGCSTVRIVSSSVPQKKLVLQSVPQPSGRHPLKPEKDNLKKYAFSPGEKLRYKVEWLGMRVARAVIEIEDIVDVEGREAYKIKLVADTNGLVAKIFPVHNEYLSYTNTIDINSIKYEADRHEGRRRKRNRTTFDYNNQKAYYTDLIKNSNKTIDITQDTYDVLTAFYYFRTMDIGTGDSIHYNVFSNGKVYPLYANVKKREYLSVRDFRTFETFLIEPYIIRNGEVDKRARVKAYFSSDERKLPVFISLRGPLFTRINIILEGIDT